MPPIQLAAHETKKVDLAEWVAPLGERFATGSIRLDYESAGFGLGSVLSMVNEADSLEVAVRLQSRGEFKSSRLEGLWWGHRGDTRITLAVLNTTDNTLTPRLILTDQEGREIRNHPVPLGPHESRVLDLSSLARRDVSPVGGISIRHDGAPGAVMAQAFVVDRRTGFSLNLPFVDPAKSGDTKLEGAGVLLGSEAESPIRFRGRLILRNTSREALIAQPVLQRGQLRSELGEIRLRGGQSKEVTVPADAIGESPDPIGIQITHTGTLGDLVGHWFSVDESGSLVVETPLKSPAPDEHVGGNHPWSLEGDTSSILYVKNAGAETSFFLGAIWHDADIYMIGRKEVAAGATAAIDIRRLRDDQVPDAFGRKLPLGLLHGQIQWRWREGSALVGRTNVMSWSKATASNMSCAACCCSPSSAGLRLDPSSVSATTGDEVDEKAVAVYEGCDFIGQFRQWEEVLSPFSVFWGSTNRSWPA